jgi:hypothetical protein
MADHGDEDRIWRDGSFFHRLIEGNCVVACAFFVRKECYPKPGPYQLDVPWASDWYVTCMIAMHFDVAYLSEPMVSVRIHEESLTTQCSRDHARLCIGDELAFLRLVGREAELAGLPSLRGACGAALMRRAVCLLGAGLKGEASGMSRADFEKILEDRIENCEERKDMQASVYTSHGDEEYWKGEREQATRSYRLALSARPGRLKTLGKYLLLRMGAIGIRVRKLFHQHRRWNVRIKFAK